MRDTDKEISKQIRKLPIVINVVKKINKEIDQGDDLKQMFRGDLLRRQHLSWRMKVSSAKNQRRAYQAEGPAQA